MKLFGKNKPVSAKSFENQAEKTLKVNSIFFTLQGEGIYQGRPSLFLRLSGCNLNCKFCFPGNVKVTTDKGVKRIEDVCVGDSVLSLDENLNEVFTKVKNVMYNEVDRSDLCKVTYRVGNSSKNLRKIISTMDHPFHVKGKGYVEASDLKKGDVIYYVEGKDRVSINMSGNNPMKRPEVSSKMAETLKGAYADGSITPYTRDEEWRTEASLRMTDSNPMHSPASVKKMLRNKVYKKSSLEEKAERILQKIHEDILYVGNDPKFLIGNKNVGYVRPDFIIKGTKKVIEVYDPTCPMYNRCSVKEQKAYESARITFFKKFGYKVFFIKADDINFYQGNGSGNKKTFLKRKKSDFTKSLNAFIYNGAHIVSVEPLDKKSLGPLSKSGCYDSSTRKFGVYNLSCAPYNTYCVDGLHVHNCDSFFDKGTSMSFESIRAEMSKRVYEFFGSEDKIPENYDTNIILVITGGEPFLQKNLGKFIEYMNPFFSKIQIESNGLVYRSIPNYAVLVISPKMHPKTKEYFKLPEDMLNRADYLKFIIEDGATVPDWAREWELQNRGRIYLSPMNMYLREPKLKEHVSYYSRGLLDKKANRRNHEYTARLAMELGFNLTLQSHLYANLR